MFIVTEYAALKKICVDFFRIETECILDLLGSWNMNILEMTNCIFENYYYLMGASAHTSIGTSPVFTVSYL